LVTASLGGIKDCRASLGRLCTWTSFDLCVKGKDLSVSPFAPSPLGEQPPLCVSSVPFTKEGPLSASMAAFAAPASKARARGEASGADMLTRDAHDCRCSGSPCTSLTSLGELKRATFIPFKLSESFARKGLNERRFEERRSSACCVRTPCRVCCVLPSRCRAVNPVARRAACRISLKRDNLTPCVHCELPFKVPKRSCQAMVRL